MQTVAYAAVFEVTTTGELIKAFEVAGQNLQDDIIDLGSQEYELAGELVLEPDEGHGLVLRHGSLIRPDTADSFRLLRLVEVPYFVEGKGATVRIDNIHFRNGLHNETDLVLQSGGGGAVLSNRRTVIFDSKFSNNRSMGNTSGGAIFHTGDLEISNALFANNGAISNEDSQVTHGGAIATKPGASLFVSHSYFLGNTADEGGAIYADHSVANVNITRSTFDGNKAWNVGGAIWSNVGEGELRISNTSFIANTAPLGGGGLYTQSLFTSITLTHLTFWANQSNEGNGGGIAALIPRDGSNIVLRNSILASNIGGNCANTQGDNLSLQISAYNLVDDESCDLDGSSKFAGVGEIFAGKLNFYEGLIPVLPIPSASLASNLVPRESCLDYDARDVPRLDNGEQPDVFCDAGAFEYVPAEQIDLDGDNIRNRLDNCVRLSNPLQSDIDNDGIGDACDKRDDRDTDGDSILNFVDNCMTVSNFLQLDSDNNGMGDACDQNSEDFDIAPELSTVNRKE